jgi:hypothetical protein
MDLKRTAFIHSVKGQNVIEYLLLTTACIVVFFVFMKPSNGRMKNTLENVVNSTVSEIDQLNKELKF